MTAADAERTDVVESARREIREHFLKHAKLSGSGAETMFDHVYAQTVGNYLTCPKEGGAPTPDWKTDEKFREFVLRWTSRIAINLKEKGKETPTGKDLEDESVAVMRAVHDDLCDRLPWCAGVQKPPALRPVCDLFLSSYEPSAKGR